MMVLSKILLFDVYPVISEGHQLVSLVTCDPVLKQNVDR